MTAGAALFIIMLALPTAPVLHASALKPEDEIAEARMLYEEGRWHDLLQRLAGSVESRSADLNYYRGMALARLERWPEAQHEFAAGRRKSPRDKRFPLELAGVALRQNERDKALSLVQAALRLDPADHFANDFAGTLFLLKGNTRAALKYWNRIGKPALEQIRSLPEPSVDPVLLDRAFVVRPASAASLRDYDATLARLRLLHVFQLAKLELVPTQNERFDLVFRNVKRTGISMRPVSAAATLLSGLPFATVYPRLINVRGTGFNMVSLLRWDTHKRRLAVELSGPPAGNPGQRMRFDFDARDEDWDISESVTRGYSGVRSFPLKRLGAGLTLGMTSGSWGFETGGHVARRDFRLPEADAGSEFLRDGLSLKYEVALSKTLYSDPDHGVDVQGRTRLQAGRLFGVQGNKFKGVAAAVYSQWRPDRAAYSISGRIDAGAISAGAPFDEFFSLGMERDNDIFLRGHNGIGNGSKGRGPLGTRYFRASCELARTLSNTGLWRLTAGPFLDAGKIFDANGVFGSQRLLVDLGVQIRIYLLNLVELTFSFGKDLRSGRHAFFLDTPSGFE